MRAILALFLLLFSPILITAQDSTRVETPKIITSLKVGNTFSFATKSIKFVKVIEDSRCPADATCFWPGEVKIRIAFYEQNVLLEEKEFVFGTQNINPNRIKELLSIEQKTIYGYDVNPHPVTNSVIEPSDYQLELLVK